MRGHSDQSNTLSLRTQVMVMGETDCPDCMSIAIDVPCVSGTPTHTNVRRLMRASASEFESDDGITESVCAVSSNKSDSRESS